MKPLEEDRYDDNHWVYAQWVWHAAQLGRAYQPLAKAVDLVSLAFEQKWDRAELEMVINELAGKTGRTLTVMTQKGRSTSPLQPIVSIISQARHLMDARL